jgi:hypothetical protein
LGITRYTTRTLAYIVPRCWVPRSRVYLSILSAQATVHALRVGVATELMVPPLPPRQPSEVPALPPGGCIFPSDHYPVFADVQLVPRC